MLRINYERRCDLAALKGALCYAPTWPRATPPRIEAHIFIAFLAYCLQVTSQPRLTARSALQKFAAVQMIDVHLPTTDGRELVLSRYTQPEPDLRPLLAQLNLSLPPQHPPKIGTAAGAQISLM